MSQPASLSAPTSNTDPHRPANSRRVLGGSGRAWPLPSPVRWLVNGLQLIAIAAWSVVCITYALLKRWRSGSPLPALRVAHDDWAPVVLRLLGLRVEAAGLDRISTTGPYVFTANHQSMSDIPIIYGLLEMPLVFVLKQELRKVPFLGWYADAMGMIFVRRGDRAQCLRSMKGAYDQIANGTSILTFPEGTRSRDGELLPFRSGALVPAIEMDVPVVPIAITGSGHNLPSGSLRIRPNTVRVLFGEPIPTTELTVADRRELANRVRSATSDLLQRLEARTS